MMHISMAYLLGAEVLNQAKVLAALNRLYDYNVNTSRWWSVRSSGDLAMTKEMKGQTNVLVNLIFESKKYLKPFLKKTHSETKH